MTYNTIEFGTDGIRGIAGEHPLDPITVMKIGRAIGQWLFTQAQDGEPWAILGRDTRISGHFLSAALKAGLLAEGVSLSDAGVMTTPGVAFLTRHGGFDLGIVISASHNPFEQNGIKLFGADGFKLSDDAEASIEALINQPTDARPPAGPGQAHYPPRHGVVEDYALAEVYISHLTAFGAQHRLDGLTVILDGANGAASELAPQAFRRDGATVIALNCAPNGLNINVEAGSEFVRRDRSAMVAALQEHRADVGIAFDGDADRVVFVTPQGALIDGDHTLAILATAMKSSGALPGDVVVATDMSNSGLENYLQAHGIRLERTKVGDRYVMERLRAGNFALGGEQAGHIITLDADHTAGDGIYVGLLVAALVAQAKRDGTPTLHEMAAHIRRYPQVIASAHLNSRVDIAALPAVEAHRTAALNAFGGRGRVNLRFSGTEPNLLRAMVEGGPENTLREVIDHALALCHVVAEASQTPHPHIDVVDCVTGEPVSI